MAYTFINKTKQNKFTGVLEYQGKNFEYELYILPLHEEDKEEVIRKFGNRIRNGSVCLDLTEERVRENIENENNSGFAIVKEVGTQDVGSGSLQIYNWCNEKKGKSAAQLWIHDVCRIIEPGTPKSIISPIKVLFHLFEQLAIYNLNKRSIHLMVEESEKNVLVPIYQSYGFIAMPMASCSGNEEMINMVKTHIVRDPKYDFLRFTKEANSIHSNLIQRSSSFPRVFSHLNPFLVPDVTDMDPFSRDSKDSSKTAKERKSIVTSRVALGIQKNPKKRNTKGKKTIKKVIKTRNTKSHKKLYSQR